MLTTLNRSVQACWLCDRYSNLSLFGTNLFLHVVITILTCRHKNNLLLVLFFEFPGQQRGGDSFLKIGVRKKKILSHDAVFEKTVCGSAQQTLTDCLFCSLFSYQIHFTAMSTLNIIFFLSVIFSTTKMLYFLCWLFFFLGITHIEKGHIFLFISCKLNM